MRRRTFLKESAIAAAGIAAAGAVRLAAEPLEAQRQNGSSVLVDPKPLFELSPYLYMQFMEPLGATDGSVEAAWDHLRDRVARRCRGGHARARADDDAMGRHLCGLLSLAGRRRAARRASADAQPALGWHRVEPGGHRRVRRLLPDGRRRAADLRQLRVGRPPAVHEGQGQRSHGRREGSRRVGGLLQRPGAMPSGRRTGAPRRSASATGRSGTRPPTTRTASTSRPRRARPSSSPRRCVQPIRRFS